MMAGRVIFVMGVSGCGKSTLAEALASHLGATCLEGDSFHPPENVAAMASGQPLTDEMRWGWLQSLGRAAAQARADGAVVAACSALKASYRDLLRAEAGPLTFLFLDGPRALIETRMQARKGHYMPPALLDSQIATLERPGAVETDVVTLSLDDTPQMILTNAIAALA